MQLVRGRRGVNFKPSRLFFTDAAGYSVLWHVSSGQILSKLNEERQCLAAAVAPGCETFCTSGSDGCLIIYDANTHTKIRTLEPRWVVCVNIVAVSCLVQYKQ